MEVQIDRFGWGRGGSARCWASGVWPEITWWHGLQGAGFPQQQVPEGVPPGLALAVEVRWWKLQCSTLGPGGWWCWCGLGLSSWAGRTAQPAFCFLLQMADCGGLPQVVQVRHTLALPWHLGGTEPFVLLALKLPSLFPQPGKLTEAFKYFVQGMGYSKWQT